MQIIKKVIGFTEILIGILAALLAISLLIGLLRDDPFAGEWGVVLIPIDIVVAATFGWAGYVLVTDKPRALIRQTIPATAVVVIVSFLLWADSV